MGSSAPFVLAIIVAGVTGFGVYRTLGRRSSSPSAGADIRLISKGEPLNLRDFLVPGKYTLFDYYANWCSACRAIAPALEEMARRHREIAVRKIDIVDWSHPVAEQQGVRDLPFLRLYSPGGRLIREGEETLEDLRRLFGFGSPAPSP